MLLKYALHSLLLSCFKLLSKLSDAWFDHSLYRGNKQQRRRAELDYGRCVHRSKILSCAKPYAFQDALLNKHFILSHISYHGTEVLLEDNVSLMGFGEKEAFFAVTPGESDPYEDRDGGDTFLLIKQFETAKELLTVPLPHFLRFADELGFPKVNLVLLFHTGRCGSTLLAKMVGSVDHTVTMIEPDFLTQSVNHRVRLMHPQSVRDDPKALIEAAIRVQCKPIRNRVVENVIIKPRGSSVSLMSAVSDSCPYARFIFMHRDPVKTVTSIMSGVPGMGGLQGLFVRKSDRVLLQYESGLPENPELMLAEEVRRMRVEQESCYDHLRNWSQLLALRYLNYKLFCRKSGGDVLAVSYEALLSAPEKTMLSVLSHCQMPTANEVLLRCLAVMGTDSQQNSPISREKLKTKMEALRLTKDDLAVINDSFLRLGLPELDDFDRLFENYCRIPSF